jgi:hypothetical protein
MTETQIDGLVDISIQHELSGTVIQRIKVSSQSSPKIIFKSSVHASNRI